MRPGRLARLCEEIRTSPLFDLAVPLEASVGWPLPRMDAGRVCVALPLHGAVGPGGGSGVHPPLALVTIPWTDAAAGAVPPRIVEYRDLRWSPVVPADDPDAAIATPARGPVAPPGERATADEVDEALGLIERMLDALRSGQDIGPDEAGRLCSLLPALMEPALVPHYRALAPRFTERFLGAAGPG